MKKLNHNQRNRRRRAFQAMGSAPRNLWRNLFPIEEPVPITQMHARRDSEGGISITPKVATTIIVSRDADGNIMKGADGKPILKRVPVCRHRCTVVNMRHTDFDALRPRDERRAALAS